MRILSQQHRILRMAQTVGVDIIRLERTATYAYCAAGRNVVLWRENAEEVWYEYSNAGGRPGHCPGLRYSLESEGYTVTHCATVARRWRRWA